MTLVQEACNSCNAVHAIRVQLAVNRGFATLDLTLGLATKLLKLPCNAIDRSSGRQERCRRQKQRQ